MTKIFFSENEHFYLLNKTFTVSSTKITFTCLQVFFMLFPKKLYFIKKYHNLLTIFGTENSRPYLVDFEWRVSRVQKFIFIALKWPAKNFMTTDAKNDFFLRRKITRLMKGLYKVNADIAANRSNQVTKEL